MLQEDHRSIIWCSWIFNSEHIQIVTILCLHAMAFALETIIFCHLRETFEVVFWFSFSILYVYPITELVDNIC